MAKERIRSAGVPGWAPWSPDDADHPCFYLWVDDTGEVRSALVGRPDDDARRMLLAECRSMLAGAGRPGAPAIDVAQPTAVVLVSLNGSGHGVLARSVHRPLGEMLSLALAQLTDADRDRGRG
jgi:hypothetical protein